MRTSGDMIRDQVRIQYYLLFLWYNYKVSVKFKVRVYLELILEAGLH
jgi:hypothetical protein